MAFERYLLMDLARAELALRILGILAKGDPVPVGDAIQLRNWAVRPQDVTLPLDEIAHGILKQETRMSQRSKQSKWRQGP
jgi:hypothetical protein